MFFFGKKNKGDVKTQRGFGTVNSEIRVDGECQLPSDIETIRLTANNNQFMYKIYGDIANKKCKIVVEDGLQVIVIRNGVSGPTLSSGSFDLFDTEELLGIFKLRDIVPVTIIVFNEEYLYHCNWGTDGIPYRDPNTDIAVQVRGYGTFDVTILDFEKFKARLIGNSTNYTSEMFEERIVSTFNAYLKRELVTIIHDNRIDYLDLPLYEMTIAENARIAISELFAQQFGLEVTILTIEKLTINDEDKAKVEAEFLKRRDELKNKNDAKEIADQIEKLEDKAWERSLILKKLESEDIDKFYDVLKELGWPVPKTSPSTRKYCPKCGAPVDATDDFCPVCGEKMTSTTISCPNCGKSIRSKNNFCPYCGANIKEK